MNGNWSDELATLDEVGPSRDLWDDALTRARKARSRRGTSSGLVHGLTRMRSGQRRTAVTVCVAVLAALSASSALAYHYLGSSQGLSAGLSSLDNIAPSPWPSSLPKGGLADEAAATGLTLSEAEQRLRLAQSGLPLGQGNGGDVNLYAFPGNSGSACIFATGPLSGSICLPADASSNPALDGVAWAAWAGNGAQTSSGPLAVFGLAADDVSQVESDVNGVARTIPIVNNSFYADYDEITSGEAIKLVVRFDDGTARTLTAPNPYEDNGPTKILPYTPVQVPNPQP
jgi:hypothetical protein